MEKFVSRTYTLRLDAESGRNDARASADVSRADAAKADTDGSTFDGRYVYFIPTSGDWLARYDSQADFSSSSAWTSVDLTRVGFYGGARGAAFDGRYLYMAPTGFGSVVRFDAKERGPLPAGHNASFYQADRGTVSC